MPNSVSTPPLDVDAVAGRANGALDRFDFVDGIAGLITHPRARVVPQGAPVVAGGWSADPCSFDAPARVCLVVDGAHAFEARTGVSRLDVPPEMGAAPAAGYEVCFPTAQLPAGGHEARALALSADGSWYDVGGVEFWTTPTPRPSLGTIARQVRAVVDAVVDLAPDGSVAKTGGPIPIGRYALLTGYVFDPQTRIRVTGAVASDRSGRMWSAPCNIIRADVRSAACLRDERIGFEIVVPADDVQRGRHLLMVSAFDADGRLFAAGTQVIVDVTPPIRRFPAFPRRRAAEARAAAVFVLPDADAASPARLTPRTAMRAARGKPLTIEGWALDAVGRGAGTVYVELAPAAAVPPYRFAALAGYRRSGLPLGLTARPPQPDAWFTADIDTAVLTPGAYRLGLAVFDDDQRTYASAELGTLSVLEDLGVRT